MLAVAASAAAAVAAAQQVPTPPQMTANQQKVMAAAVAQARPASAAAEAGLLAFLATDAFRKRLSEFAPSLDAGDPAALLKSLRGAVDVTENVHNWDAGAGHNPASLSGVHLNETGYDYFFNGWELKVLGWSAEQPTDTGGAEEDIFGFPPFAHSPPTYEDAEDRLVYCAKNLWKVDGGNPHFGSVSTVFSNAYTRNATVISAIDTGIYQGACMHELRDSPRVRGPGPGNSVNCTAWQGRELGTLDDYLHLFLANAQLWQYEQVDDYVEYNLARQVARMLGPWAGDSAMPLDQTEVSSKYWEANTISALFYPTAIRFHIASFQLFGSADGDALREWCKQRGWPLVWSNNPTFDGPYSNGPGPGPGPHPGPPGPNPPHQQCTTPPCYVCDFNKCDADNCTCVQLDHAGPLSLAQCWHDCHPHPAPVLSAEQQYRSNQRLLDPAVLSAVSAGRNMTVDDGMHDVFSSMWSKVNSTVGSKGGSARSYLDQQWEALWAAANTSVLSIEPLRPGACADTECIGTVVGGGQCVCS